MHTIGTAVVDRLEDGLGVQVALCCGLSAEGVGLVGEAHVQRVAIELAVHRDRLDAEIASRANDPDGDLPAVGDQDLGEHECQSWSMTTPDAIWQIQIVDETGSTNTDLLSAAASGAPDRSVLMARHQTAGRGRLDRTWIAPPGSNLLVSLLFRKVPEQPHELTRRVALAAAAACRAIAGVTPTLKWPNDLLLDGRKLAGVLAQAGGAGPTTSSSASG